MYTETNYDYLNQSKVYVARVTGLDSGMTRCIKFVCPLLSNSELRAIPLSDHNRLTQIGDEVLIVQPLLRFSDTIFYIPIRVDPFIGLKNENNNAGRPSFSKVDLTNPGNITLIASNGIRIEVPSNTKNRSNIITISDSGDVEITGNLHVHGTITSDSNYISPDQLKLDINISKN